MDPDTALERLREALAADDTDAAADAAEALDQWLTKGGYLPSAWNHTETDPN